jgi:hypothetical protein
MPMLSSTCSTGRPSPSHTFFRHSTSFYRVVYEKVQVSNQPRRTRRTRHTRHTHHTRHTAGTEARAEGVKRVQETYPEVRLRVLVKSADGHQAGKVQAAALLPDLLHHLHHLLRISAALACQEKSTHGTKTTRDTRHTRHTTVTVSYSRTSRPDCL